MNRQFPIGFLFCLVALIAYKARSIGMEVAPDDVWLFARAIFFSDIWIVCSSMIVWMLVSLIPIRAIRYFLYLIIIFCCFVIVCDSLLLINLNTHLLLSDFWVYAPEWRKIFVFLGLREFIQILLILVICHVTIKISGYAQHAALAAFLGLISITVAIPKPLTLIQLVDSYSFSTALRGLGLSFNTIQMVFNGELNKFTQFTESESELAYNVWSEERVLSLKDSHKDKDIVLLIVESLSTIDSKRLGGIYDRLPNIDRISKNGTAFPNFLANYKNTEGGLVSILTATEPIPYPNSTANLHRAHLRPNSVVQAFNKLGYYTEYLTNSDISFTDQAYFCKNIGFETVRGRDEVGFEGAPRTAFGCPPDEYLYAEFMQRWKALKDLNKPKFFTLVTISSHLPFVDPHIASKRSTQEAVLQYVDSEIGKFYDHLSQEGFFKNGILIILGDHRKMLPLTEYEFNKFGKRAEARVPLVLVGNSVAAGKIDERLFSQVDLFPKLQTAIDGDGSTTLSDQVIFTDNNTILRGFGDTKANLWIFTPEEEYLASVDGTKFNWQGSSPENAKRIEERLQLQRAAQQYSYSKRGSFSCVFQKPNSMEPSDIKGIEVLQYEGTEIKDSRNQNKFIGRKIQNKLNYPDFNKSDLVVPEESSITFQGFIYIEQPGKHTFALQSDDGACLGIDGVPVVEGLRTYYEDIASIELSQGYHWIELRYYQTMGEAFQSLYWLPPGEDQRWQEVDSNLLFLPK